MTFNVTPKKHYGAFILVLSIFMMAIIPGMLSAQRVYATSQTNGVSGLCLLCGVTNAANPVNNANLDDYSQFSVTVGLLGVSVQQTLIFPTINPNESCDSLVIGIGNSGALLSANLLGGVSFETLNGTTPNNDAVSGQAALLRLLSGDNQGEIVLRPTSKFDRVRVTLSSNLLGALADFRLYYAYYNEVDIIPPTITTPASLNVCEGNSIDLTATTATPEAVISWYTVPTGGTPITNPVADGTTLTVTPASGTTTYYAQTALDVCTNTTRSAVSVTTTALPAVPALANTTHTICAGDQTTFNVQNPVSGVTYNWYDAPTGGNLLASGLTYTTPNLNAATDYYVEAALSTGCVSATRAQASVAVNPSPAAPSVNNSNVTINSGQSVTFSIPSPEPGVTYTWYDSPAKVNTLATGASYTTPILFGTTNYYVEAMNGTGCTSPLTTLTATINAQNNVPCSFANQDNGVTTSGICLLCNVSNPANVVDLDTSTASTMSVPVGVAGSVNHLIGFSNTYAAGDSIVIVLQSPGQLLNLDLLSAISVRPYLNATALGSGPISLNNSLVGLKLLGIIGGTGRYRVSIPVDEDFNGVMISLGSLVSALATVNVFYVAATVQYPVPLASNVNICTGNTADLSVTAAANTSVNWYDVPTGGTALATNTTSFTTPALTNTKTYYVGISRFGCENGTRVPITVNVNQVPTAPALAVDTVSLCAGNTATFAIAAPDGDLTYRWYSTATGGTPLDSGATFTTAVLNNNATYYVESSANGCTSATRSTAAAVVTQAPANVTVTPSTTSVVQGGSATFTASSTSGNVTYNWFVTPTGGTSIYTGASFTTPPLVANTTYYVEAVDNTTGCVTLNRTAATVTVNSGAIDLSCGAAISQSNTSNGLCIGCSVQNPGLSVDSSTETGSRIGVVLGLLNAYAAQRLTFDGVANVGDSIQIGLTLPSSLADVGLLSTVQVVTYNGGTANNDLQDINAAPITLKLLAGNQKALVTFAATATFDAVELRLNSGALTALNAINLDYARVITAVPTVQEDTVSVCPGQTATLNAISRPNTTFRWFADATGGSPLFTGASYTTPAITANTTYYVEALSASGCTSPTRTAVYVQTGLPSVTVTSNSVSIPVGETADLSVNTPEPTFTYQWYNVPTGGTALSTGPNFTTPNLFVTTVYYVEASNGAGCASATRVPVTVNVTQTPGAADVPCGSATSQTNAADGLCVGCYVENPGFAVDSSTTTGSTIHLILGLLSGSVSQTLEFPTASNIGDTLVVGLTFPSSLADLGLLANVQIGTANGGTSNNDLQAINGGGLISLTLLNNNQQAIIKYAPTAAFDKVQIQMNAGLAQAISAVNVDYATRIIAPAVPVSNSVNVCVGDTATLEATARLNTTFRWYATATGGSSLYNGQSFKYGPVMNDTTFYVEAVSSTGCISPVRVPVSIMVGLSNVSVTANEVTVDRGQSATLSVDNPDANFTYDWFDEETGGTSVHTGATFVTPAINVTTVYYVEATNANGCKSNMRIPVTVYVRQDPGSPDADCGAANSQTNAANGICVGCYVENPGLAIDSSKSTGSTIHVILGLVGGSVSQTLIYPSPSNVGDSVVIGLTFPSSIADVGLLANIQVGTYNGATFNNDYADLNSSLINLQLLNNSESAILKFAPGATFDRVEIKMNSGVAQALSAINVDYASRVYAKPLLQSDTVAVCTGQTATLSIIPQANTTYRWYNKAVGGSVLATGNSFTTGNISVDSIFYVEAVTSSGCVSSERTPAVVTVGLPGVEVTSDDLTVNLGETAHLSVNNPDTTYTYEWYDVATGGTALATGADFTTPAMTVSTVYYVEATNNIGCKTASRIPVRVTVLQAPGPNDVPCGAATTQTNTANGLCVGCYIENPGLAIDSSSITGSTVHVILGLVNAYASQTLIFPSVSNVGDSIHLSLTFPSSLADVSVLGGVQVLTYNGTTSNNDLQSINSSVISLQLLANNTGALISYAPTKAFDRIEVRLNSGLAQALNAVNVNYAARIVGPAMPSADSVTICQGTTAILSADVQPNTSYRWYANATGGTPLASADNFTTPNLNTNTTYYLEAISSAGCISPVRVPVQVIVTSAPNAPTVADTTILTCGGTTARLEATGPAGASFRWYNQASGGTTLADSAVFITPVLDSSAIYYVESYLSAGCASASRTAVKVEVTTRPEPPVVTPDAPTICAGNTATMVANSTSASATIYWYASETADTALATGNTFTTPALNANTTYYVGTSNGQCESATRTAVTVMVNPLPVAPTIVSNPANGIVPYGSAAELTASSATSNVTYHWYRTATGGTEDFVGATFQTPQLTDDVVYYVEAVSASGCTSGRTAIALTVDKNFNPGCDIANAQTAVVDGVCVLCAITDPNNSVDNDTTNFAQINIPVGVVGASYGQRLNFGSVSNLGDSVSIILEVPNTVINASILGAITINSINAGASNNENIQLNNAAIKIDLLGGGTNKFKVTFKPAAAFDEVEVKIGGGLVTGFNNLRVYYAYRVVPAPEIALNDVTICAGSTATFNATAPAGVQVNWYTTAVGGTPIATNTTSFTTPALDTFAIYYAESVRESTSCPNPIRKAVFVNVLPVPDPPVIVTSDTTICPGNTVVLKAVASNSTTQIRWFDAATNGNLLATDSIYITPALSSTTTYYVETYNGTCTNSGARAAVTVNVGSIAPTPVLQAPTLALCAGGTATFNVVAETGVTYRWYNTSTGGTAIFTGATFTTPVLNASAVYYVEASTGDCASATGRVAATATVNAIPGVPVLVNDQLISCGNNSVTFNIQNPRANLTYNWYDAAVNGNLLHTGINFTTVPASDSVTYFVEALNGSSCASSTRALATVKGGEIPPAPTVDSTSYTVCSGTNLSLNVKSPQSGHIYQWFDAPTGGNLLFTGSKFITPILTMDRSFYVADSTASGCSSSSRTQVDITVKAVPTAPVVVDGTEICAGNTTTLLVQNRQNGIEYRWYDAMIGGNLLATDTAYTTPSLTNTTTYFVEAYNGTCTNTSGRVAVVVSVKAVPTDVVVDADSVAICSGSTAMLHVSNPLSGITYRWYDAATGGNVVATGADFTTPVLSVSTDYYVEAININNCMSANRTKVTVSVNDGIDVPELENADVVICRNTVAILTIKSPRAELQYDWYDAPSGGNLVFTGSIYQTPALSTDATYYVAASLKGGTCTSASRATVKVTVADAPTTPVLVNGAITTCSNSTATFEIQNPQPNVTYRWYDADMNGNLVFTGASFTTGNLTANITYYVEAVIGNTCASTGKAEATATVGPRPGTPMVTGNADPICPNSPDTLTATSTDAGVIFNWYTSSTATTPVFTGNTFITPALAATTTYYVEAAYANSGCTSTSREQATVTVLETLAQPTVTVQSKTASSVTFQWDAIPGAIGYRVSFDNGVTSVFRSKDSLTYTVSGLQPAQSVSLQVMAIGLSECANSGWFMSDTDTDNPAGNLVFVPNAFTPNNDGLNDILYVYGTTISNMQIWIYNQWGQLVFQSKDQTVGWDGTMSGKKQPVGVYNYVLKAQLQDGTIVNKRGTITIIR